MAFQWLYLIPSFAMLADTIVHSVVFLSIQLRNVLNLTTNKRVSFGDCSWLIWIDHIALAFAE